MAPEYNIKISELDPFTSPRRTEDFFPLVDSSSMTTYRATIQDIGSLITQSLSASYVPATAVIGSVQFATSASWASCSISASWAKSASHALLSDSASWYPPQQFPASASWASRSLQAWYSTRSIDVDTHGPQYNFPYWTSNTPGAGNGNLNPDSPIVYYPYSGDTGLLTIDSASTALISSYPYPAQPYFQVWQYGDRANVPWGFAGVTGIQSIWPITSQTFIGTDQRDWYFTTSSTPHAGYDPYLQVTNSYFSGSAGDSTSGSFYTIPNAPGALASIFNGKWVRFAARSITPAAIPNPVPPHAAMGEMWSNEDQIMKGLISIQVGTTLGSGGSNAWNQVDFYVHQNQWGGGISATVLHANTYGPQLIRAIRLHTAAPNHDPSMCIDVLIDGLYSGGEAPGYLGEPVMSVKAQSWQGIRFLKWLNVDPWPFQDTGSNDITQDSTQLIFPAAPGFYSNVSKAMNYYVQGKNVVIWPNANQLTQSGASILAQASTQSLFVSGNINTNTAYCCDNNVGLTTQVVYGTNNLYFSGGILIGKYPPDGMVTPAGTPCGQTLKYAGGQTMPFEQNIILGSDTGPVIVAFDMYDNPDRLQVWFDGNVVHDTGYRGAQSYEATLNAGLTAHGSASETPATIISPGQGNFTWYKNSATTYAKIQVFAPDAGTAWNFTMSCPNQPLPS